VTRLRLLLLVAGVGTLVAGLPAGAGVRQEPSPGVAADEARALQLLGSAAQAARVRTYSGTQYVSTWHPGAASSHVADVQHQPGVGSVVTVHPTAGDPGTDSGSSDTALTVSSDLDARLLGLLADHYDLAVAGADTCTGRSTRIVEARRAGVTGDGAVAGRFWVDDQTTLVLRREVFDRAGRLVRSSAFASLSVSPLVAKVPEAPPAQVDAATVDDLRRDGWRVPMSLPGGLDLFDARVRTHEGPDVLHLSYSDGLSTLSLFAQRGRLGKRPMSGFAQQKVAGAPVWVRSSVSPQRVVWGGGGRVFTLLTDAPPDSVRDVVKALPHDRAPRHGLLARLSRGLSRLASWINPFD
jgi:sigma-E factor negative regulatory protein RseB